MTIADAGLDYIARPGGVRRGDLWRLDRLADVIGDWPIARANAAFGEFVKQRCAGLAPATVERFRTVFSAAINYAAKAGEFVAPKVKRVAKVRPRPITYLTGADAERLIAAYAPHVRPIATVLAFQGLRIGEAMRLDWQHVRWAADALYIIPETKTGEPRGEPYADHREHRLPGGSPIRKAHGTACRRAGIVAFRVHDWRHHWACHCVMSGIDLETLRLEGGWASLRMVERYATVSAAHRATQMRKLGMGQ